MYKQYKVLCLNGPNKGKEVLETCSYTEEEVDDAVRKMQIVVDGIKYAGYCRCCGWLVQQEKAEYIENTDGRCTLSVDVFHRWCL